MIFHRSTYSYSSYCSLFDAQCLMFVTYFKMLYPGCIAILILISLNLCLLSYFAWWFLIVYEPVRVFGFLSFWDIIYLYLNFQKWILTVFLHIYSPVNFTRLICWKLINIFVCIMFYSASYKFLQVMLADFTW